MSHTLAVLIDCALLVSVIWLAIRYGPVEPKVKR